MRTVQEGVKSYIDLLNRTSPLAPVNSTHHYLRGLYDVHGRPAVDAELDRQFADED
jgi:hypothetical protein